MTSENNFPPISSEEQDPLFPTLEDVDLPHDSHVDVDPLFPSLENIEEHQDSSSPSTTSVKPLSRLEIIYSRKSSASGSTIFTFEHEGFEATIEFTVCGQYNTRLLTYSSFSMALTGVINSFPILLPSKVLISFHPKTHEDRYTSFHLQNEYSYIPAHSYFK